MDNENENIPARDKLASAVQAIKDAILQSQQRALGAVNQEQLALYYGIGRYISANTRTKNWGKGFIEGISQQLQKELPGLRGFSATNLRNMRAFYEEWKMLETDNSSVQTDKHIENDDNSSVRTDKLIKRNAVLTDNTTQSNEIHSLQRMNLPDFPVVAFLSISFTHHIAILANVKSYEERKFYIQFAADYKVKTDELVELMKENFFSHQGSLPNNFRQTIPDQLQAFRANAMFKDGPFKTAYLGQLAGYLRILDDEVRKPNENPSIGIILCKSANKKFVEYVIQDYDKPMGVATFKTSADMDDRLKKLLPPVEDLEKLL